MTEPEFTIRHASIRFNPPEFFGEPIGCGIHFLTGRERVPSGPIGVVSLRGWAGDRCAIEHCTFMLDRELLPGTMLIEPREDE